MRRVLAGAAALVALAGCFGPDPGLTPSGKGLPRVQISHPPQAAVGEVVEATLTVANPGPGEMAEVVVVFTRLGDPELPYPIVEGAPGERAVGVVGVDPAPRVRSKDGITYRFPGLPEGDEMQVTFRLEIPAADGPVGNSIQVYDSSDPGRARGVGMKIDLREA